MPEGYYLSKQKYVQNLLDRSGLTDTRTAETPMELSLQLRATDGDLLEDPSRYRHLVGSLVYLVSTRPDIAYVVHILSQFMARPTHLYHSHLLRVLRYCVGLSLVVCFSLALPHYSFRRTPMRPGLVILLIVVLFLLTVFFLAP